MTAGSRRGVAGFTLLETLVALAILGVVMTTVYGVISGGLRAAHRDEDRLLLGLVAQNLLARSRLDLDPANGALRGDIDGGLRWTISGQPYQLPDDILPEAPPADAAGLGSSRDERSSRSAAESFTRATQRTRAGADGSALGEEGRADTESPQRRREPLRMRMITVVVEKGDQRVELSTLAWDRARDQPSR